MHAPTPLREYAPRFAIVMGTIAFAFSLPSRTFAQDSAADAQANALFTGTNILRIEIEIPRESMAQLRPYRWVQNNPTPKPEAMALVREGGRVYSNVVVQPKGSMGSFQPIDSQPALTLNFDKHVDGQKFHGLTKISLNNSVQDRSYIKEKLSRELFNEIGVPAPRSDFAFVTLNGRDLGLYALVEGANKQFLKQHFKDTSGTLYDGGFIQEITAPLDITYGNKKNDRADLRALAAAARITDRSKRFTEMSRLMDIDRFIKSLAMEALLAHWDGYAQNKNNYRIYHDPTTDRLVFIEHGLDLILLPGRTQDRLFPNMPGLLGRAVLTTDEGKERYLQRIREYHATIFQPEALAKRIDKIDAKLHTAAPAVTAQPALRLGNLINSGRILSDQQGQSAQLRRMIQMRWEFVAQELAGQPERISTPVPLVLEFSTNYPSRIVPIKIAGQRPLVATLSGWRSHVAPTRVGTVGWTFDEAEREGQKCLRIVFDNGAGTASWRARVVLPAGRFLFTGRAKTVPGNRGQSSLVRLRVSGESNTPYQRGDNWIDLSFEIVVPPDEAPMEPELVCEATGNGEVWFDKDSLLIVRVP